MAGAMTGFGAGCLAEPALDALSAGQLSPASRRTRWRQHLDGVEKHCRELLAALRAWMVPRNRSPASAGARADGPEDRPRGAAVLTRAGMVQRTGREERATRLSARGMVQRTGRV